MSKHIFMSVGLGLMLFFGMQPFAVSDNGDLLELSIQDSLKQIGFKKYAKIKGPSRTIPYIFLAYDEQGNLSGAAAYRKVKSYETITLVTIVSKDSEGYVLKSVEIPDAEVIKDLKKRLKVINAVKDLKNQRIYRKNGGKYHKVDAVSGATRYQKRIYAAANYLCKVILKVLMNPPKDPAMQVLE
ncbi:MAG: hypothetical protein D6820_02980 [Lentisphaerae bacterium]|nr:MAG: hypothetical protein D6820_02980 [Lentisphaerota bacterium]